jgi:2Fe-2S ferredoxin
MPPAAKPAAFFTEQDGEGVMAELRVTDRNGGERTIRADSGRPLMEALRDANLNVQGTCGGACSCGTCHVYIKQVWADKLPPRTEDEQMMLEAIGELVEVRANSRLSCQIEISDALSGIEVEIAPEV